MNKGIAVMVLVIVSILWPGQEHEIHVVVLHTQDISGVGTLSDLRGPVEYRVFTDHGMFTTSAEIYEDIVMGPMTLKVKDHVILERVYYERY